MVKTKQKSPSCLKGLDKLLPKGVEWRLISSESIAIIRLGSDGLISRKWFRNNHSFQGRNRHCHAVLPTPQPALP